MKSLFVAFRAMVTFSLAAVAQDLPGYLKRDAEYDGIRDNLAQDDWAPVKAESCTAYGVLCDLYPELESCAGTGVGACLFHWKNGSGVVLSISTAGEVDRVITGWEVGRP
jgi:hypothetical protein